eukprot:jgi/Chlat1/4368/Chrsp29S04524
MVPPNSYEAHAQRLLDPNMPIPQRLQAATEIRDIIEVVHTSEYPNFLSSFCRPVCQLLMKTSPQKTAENLEHKLRNVLLEILNRLPHNEVLRPFVPDLLKLSMHVLDVDNEDNALICLRIIFDLHKNFRPSLENEVPPFLEFVCKIYQNFQGTVVNFFERDHPAPAQFGSQSSDLGLISGTRPGSAGGSTELPTSSHSFKVITECPLIVMFLFQLYPNFSQPNIARLLPRMVDAISITGPQAVPAHLKQHYADMKAAQVKTVSFLTYLLRSYTDVLRQHEEIVSKSVVELLMTCPDSVAIRKELLVATRHVLATDFRRGFKRHLDTLLDERQVILVLVGTGRACYETLRPLAYSLLAELIHHIRLELTLPQLSRIVYLFSRNVHDTTLPTSVQTTCVRLMLNLVESIFTRRTDVLGKNDGRLLLGRILYCFVSKFGTLKLLLPKLLKDVAAAEQPTGEHKAGDDSKPTEDGSAQGVVLHTQQAVDHSKELSDCRVLLKTLIMGMKTLLWSMTYFNKPLGQQLAAASPDEAAAAAAAAAAALPKGMIEEEVTTASGLLTSGLRCLALIVDSKEDDLLQHYAQMFTVMESRNVLDLFSVRMDSIFDCMLQNEHLIQLAANMLVQHPNSARFFMDVVLNHLVSARLDTLRTPECPAAKLQLKLFTLVFKAVVKYPDTQVVLRPHVVPIVEACIKSASELPDCSGYMQLLRAMFRALAGGKFDLIHREFLSVLQPCLACLLGMLSGPPAAKLQDVLVELCLTLPALLSTLLSYLSRLMQPLVMALNGNDELVQLGLRTLEYWVDSLNPKFLEPNMAHVMPDLILALLKHLRPLPYLFGAKALQLLGKLGGRNRRFLKDALQLECKDNPEHGLRLVLTFEPSTSFLVPLDRCVVLAKAAVLAPGEAHYRKQALRFIQVCLASVLDLRGNTTQGVLAAEILAGAVLCAPDSNMPKGGNATAKADLGVKTKLQLLAERTVFKSLLATIIAADAEADLAETENSFYEHVCRHFALLAFVNTQNATSSSKAVQGSTKANETEGKSTQTTNLKELDPHIFFDAIVEVLGDTNRSRAQSAQKGLCLFIDAVLLIGSARPGNPLLTPAALSMLDQLLQRLLHSCYAGTWQSQMGGVIGVGAMIQRVPATGIRPQQQRVVRALLHVLRRLPVYATAETEETSQVLQQVLKMCNSHADESESDNRQSNEVLLLLAEELFNPMASATVRKNVQEGLQLLANRKGSEVSELLAPIHTPLSTPLVSRPLRNKHIEAQVGTVAALNYCLSLRPPLLRLTAELVQLLRDALAIADADETQMHTKFINPKMKDAVTRLRTGCIELLCTAMAWNDFKAVGDKEVQTRIIAMFFKCLTCRSPEIVAVAKEGLRQVIQQQKLPKELLQNSLRPILVNLASYKNLTMPLLHGLARLLELLSNWFNVTLGEKLLEHLQKWQDPVRLNQMPKAWKTGEEPKIAAAIFELFHLLPPAAHKFLDKVVQLVIRLEGVLPAISVYSELNSPYREPLTRYLNRYATESLGYFLHRLAQPPYFNRLLDIIKSDVGQPLREELARSPDKLVMYAFQPILQGLMPVFPGGSMDEAIALAGSGPGAESEAYFAGLQLVSTIVKLQPEWLKNNPDVFSKLLQLWRSPARVQRLLNEERLPINQLKESKRLIKCFLNYIRHERSEVATLFDMLSIFTVRSTLDYTFLKEFYEIEVAKGYAPAEKKAVLHHFLQLFQTRTCPQDQLVAALQMLIMPMLSEALTQKLGGEVLDSEILTIIVQQLLDPPEEVNNMYQEPLRIELLQLATLLIKHLPAPDLVHHRKELIKFGWNHLKREDTSSKQYAFVNVCQFLKAFQSPEKIILQVLVALLRMCQPEAKSLVKQALDTLMPALPNRLQLQQDQKIPLWIRYTKKTLVEEGHSLPHLIHLWQLLVRHSHLFYSSRAQFVNQMITSLSRLGLPQNSPLENRKLAIDLSGLVIKWEKTRIATENNAATDEAAGLKRAGADGTGEQDGHDAKRIKVEGAVDVADGHAAAITSQSSLPAPGEEEFKPGVAMQEMIINFLIRIAFVLDVKDKEMQALYTHTLDLLGQALSIWPEASVKFNYVVKLLALSMNTASGQGNETVPALVTGLDVMNVVLKHQPEQYVQGHAAQILQVMEPCFSTRNQSIIVPLCSLVKKIVTLYPLDAPPPHAEAQMFHSKLEELINRHLLAGATGEARAGSTTCALHVLETVSENRKSYVDRFVPSVLKMLRVVCTGITTAARSGIRPADPSQPPAPTPPSPSSSGMANQGAAAAEVKPAMPAAASPTANDSLVVSQLRHAVTLIRHCALSNQEHKKTFLSLLQSLLAEKAVEPAVLDVVMDTVKEWVEARERTHGHGHHLSVKELTGFLSKLAQLTVSFEGSRPDWDNTLLELLYKLCADSSSPPAMRSEVFQKVERVYMLGLRSPNPSTRHRFFALYNDSIGRTLFSRLQYIINGQDWGALAGTFWLKQGLDLLLAILVEHEHIALAPNSAHVPPIVAEPHEVTPAALAQQPEALRNLVNKHVAFVNSMSRCQVSDLIHPLRELAHRDAQVAYHMWVLVFPIVWATLSKDEQITLAKPMIGLLSREYHDKQKEKRPNVVQALLEGISLSQPQPKIPSELIKFLGKTYNAWHIAIPLLESHVLLFPQEVRCFDALAELYRLLNEDDVLCGLWKRRCQTEETRAGLSLVQHGYWQRAQDVFFRGMQQAQQTGLVTSVSKQEICLWEEQWLRCARELGQWDLLADFGKSVEHYDLMLDSLWKLQPTDWQGLKDSVLPKVQVEESIRLRSVQAYVALHDGNIQDGDRAVGQGVAVALHKWWQLPELAVQSHIPLLQAAQPLVELQESTRILMEIANGTRQAAQQAAGVPAQPQNYSELKNILELWRLRLPNKWDDFGVWNDLVIWRNHMYNEIINAFRSYAEINPKLHQLGYKDKAWSVNKLATIGRKQGLAEVCVQVLNKMYGFLTMEVQEAFVKIREQAKAYLDMKGELISGINLINTTNLEYFPQECKSEMFRIKGEFLRRMGDSDAANQAFSTSIALNKNSAKGWVSWGAYCDEVFQSTNEQVWLEYAVSCYLRSLACSSPTGIRYIPRVLYLLSFENEAGTVGRVLDKFGEALPVWCWLPWISQLLMSLQRAEAPHVKAVLVRLALQYPQAVYFLLRTYLLERRDLGRNEVGGARPAVARQGMQNPQQQQQHGQGSTAPQVKTPESPAVPAQPGTEADNALSGDMGVSSSAKHIPFSPAAAFEAAKEVMETLRTKHGNLAQELEQLLTEIGTKFVPLPEERLLAVLHALLHRCYKYPAATTSEVPMSLKKELGNVCMACFSSDSVSKHGDFVNEYKRDFESDLNPESATFPATLGALTERLKYWKGVLQTNVEDRLPAALRLEDESKLLRECNVMEVEIPGQYYSDLFQQPEHIVKLERMGADVPIVRRHGSSHRRITMVGSDGSERNFLVQTSLTQNARSDERMAQLFRICNRFLDKHKETRRRHLLFHVPVIIPVWPQVRLVEDDPTYCTFGEVYEINCARYDREADYPITLFKENLNEAFMNQLSGEQLLKLRQQSYSDITANYVSENVFSQYMYKTLPTCNHLWTFKKSLASQMALSGFMSYTMRIGGRAPNKILFAKNTGKVLQMDFHPLYDSSGVVDLNESVPFRLTRNLRTFFTPFGVEGMFTASIAAAAQAVLDPQTNVQHYLAMHFRDELIAWSARRQPGVTPTASSAYMPPRELRLKVQANLEPVEQRIKSIAPQEQLDEASAQSEGQQLRSIQRSVSELVEAALSPKNLCMMEPTWHPWF